MICRSCGSEIADKAIVCYRCGTPTAEPATRSAPTRMPTSWLLVLVMAAIFAGGVWLIPKTVPGSPERILVWVATWLVIFGAVAWVRQRRR